MTRRRSCFSIAIVLLALAFPAAPSVSAQNGVELRDDVQSLLRLNLAAIDSISADYTYFFDGFDVRCRMAREGERLYHASLKGGRTGGLLPAESAWDGSQSYMRTRFGMISISRDRARYKGSSALPHDVAAGRVLNALGLAPISGDYEFIEGRRGSGDDEVILVHRRRRDGMVLTTKHSLAINGWPTSVETADAKGRLTYESSEIQYKSFESDGNTIWYPILVRARQVPLVYPAGQGPPEVPELTAEQYLRVDVSTLQINVDIDDGRFALTPWPSEDVLDETTQRIRPAVDPSWQPAGNVGFPFQEAAARFALADDRAARPAASLGRAGGSVAGSNEDATVRVLAAAAEPGWPFRWWHLLLALGILLVAGAGAIMYRQRRKQVEASATHLLRGGRRGFTLVELMVVIGTIAILISLLMPALAGARRKAVLVDCAQTMRSAGQAVSLYANDNRGRLFPTYPQHSLGPRGSRLGLLYSDGDYQDELLICGTRTHEGEWLSYIFNGWTAYDRVKLHNVGGEMAAPSETVLLGEGVRRANYELSYITPVLPGHPFLILYDDARHGELGANRLWLDMHVSRDLPRGSPDHIDPWWVPGN